MRTQLYLTLESLVTLVTKVILVTRDFHQVKSLHICIVVIYSLLYYLVQIVLRSLRPGGYPNGKIGEKGEHFLCCVPLSLDIFGQQHQ